MNAFDSMKFRLAFRSGFSFLNCHTCHSSILCGLQQRDLSIEVFDKRLSFISFVLSFGLLGFIGGCGGRVGDAIVFHGSLDRHPDGAQIRRFIEERGLKCIDFPEFLLTDIGSIIEEECDI